MTKLARKIFFSVVGVSSFAVVGGVTAVVALSLTAKKTNSSIDNLPNNNLPNNNLPNTSIPSFGSPRNLRELREADFFDVTSLPKFDMREYEVVTPVKNQLSDPNHEYLDYAYSVIAASEINILKKGILGNKYDASNLDFDVDYLSYLVNFRYDGADSLGLTSDDHFYYWDESVQRSNISQVVKALLQKNGLSFEGQIAPARFAEPAVYLDNAINVLADGTYVHDSNNANFESNIKKVKQAIANYGSVSVTYNDENQTSSSTYFASYKNNSNKLHSVAIVGWDDSISSTLFNKTGNDGVYTNGAWIVKDSRGTSWGDNGYFYLSYQSDLNEIYAFDYVNKNSYHNNYYYDGMVKDFVADESYINTHDTRRIAAVFQAKTGSNTKDEYLKAVNFGLAKANQDIEITISKLTNVPNEVYDSLDFSLIGKQLLKVSGTDLHFENPGYYTYKLPNEIKLTKGEYFIIELKSLNNDKNPFVLSNEPKSSNDLTYMLNKEGTEYVNTGANNSGAVARIKALTVNKNADGSMPESNNIANAKFRLSIGDKIYYSGTSKLPWVYGWYENTELINGVDFEVRYSNNINVGTAKVTITGINEYFGTQELSFEIQKR